MNGDDRDIASDDRIMIEELLYDYCDLVDRAWADELTDLFTDDAELDYGFGRVFRGRADIGALFADRLAAYTATSHHASNVVIGPITDDGVAVTNSIYAWHRRPDDTHAEVWGRYTDLVRRDPDRWRLARRVIRAAGWRGFATPDGLASPFEPLPRNLLPSRSPT